MTRIWLMFRKMFQHSVPALSRMFCGHVGVSDHSCNVIRSALPGYRSVHRRLDRPPVHRQVQVQAKASFLLLSFSFSFSHSLSRPLRYIPERSRNRSERNKKKATGRRESPDRQLLVYRSRRDATRETSRNYARIRIHRNFISRISIKNSVGAVRAITHQHKRSAIMWSRWQSSTNKLRDYQVIYLSTDSLQLSSSTILWIFNNLFVTCCFVNYLNEISRNVNER